MREVNNSQDVMDSRDVIEALEEMESDFEDWKADFDEDPPGDEEYPDWEELVALRNFVEQASCVDDWEYGVSIIHEDYFTEYCKEMLADIGEIPKDLPWYIESNLNWDGVADDLKADYIEVDFNGVTYYIR
jgi:hypothetical protein